MKTKKLKRWLTELMRPEYALRLALKFLLGLGLIQVLGWTLGESALASGLGTGLGLIMLLGLTLVMAASSPGQGIQLARSYGITLLLMLGLALGLALGLGEMQRMMLGLALGLALGLGALVLAW